ncbi:hypothetical protein D3C80_1687080 [compost metagenome]
MVVTVSPTIDSRAVRGLDWTHFDDHVTVVSQVNGFELAVDHIESDVVGLKEAIDVPWRDATMIDHR